MFLGDPSALLRTAVLGVLGYAALVLLLRVSGKRTLSKMNAFDFVVTVAIGSTLSALLINNNVALAQGVVALALLVGLQFVVAWLCSRFNWADRIFKSEPTLLVRYGQILHDQRRRQRVSVGEIHAAVRDAGLSQLSDAAAVILETDGTFSVTKSGGVPHGPVLDSDSPG